MSEISCRPLQEADLEGFRTVLSLTYNNGNPYPEDRPDFGAPGIKSYVAEQGGRICGACTVMEMSATRGNAVLGCGGVGGVAVLPEIRRSGIGTTMMKWLVRTMREADMPLSSLYPFREPFYRKSGYEVCGKRQKVLCPIHRWPKLDSLLTVRRLKPDDWGQLVPCYEAFAHSRSGMNIREQRHWQRVLGENRPLTIYAVGDPVEAYAVISHVTNFWTTDHVSEAIWSTRLGYEGLIAMLGGLGINKTAMTWYEPSDGPFYTDYLDQGVEFTLDRPIMYRINDVPAALAQLKPDAHLKGSFSIRVVDPLIAENEGPWHVAFNDGVVEVDPLPPGKSADIRIHIRHFAQAFLGEPSLELLARLGSVDVASASGFESAKLLLSPSPTYCLDYF